MPRWKYGDYVWLRPDTFETGQVESVSDRSTLIYWLCRDFRRLYLNTWLEDHLVILEGDELHLRLLTWEQERIQWNLN